MKPPMLLNWCLTFTPLACHLSACFWVVLATADLAAALLGALDAEAGSSSMTT